MVRGPWFPSAAEGHHDNCSQTPQPGCLWLCKRSDVSYYPHHKMSMFFVSYEADWSLLV